MAFIKFYIDWMPELGLAGNEALVFSVIHHYTEWRGGYAGGTEPLERLTGLARSGVYRILGKLTEKGYIALTATQRGRYHSTYVSLLTAPETNRPTGRTDAHGQPSYGWDSNRPTGGTLLDTNRYNNPPISPQGGNTQTQSRRRRVPRALNYMHGPSLTEDQVRTFVWDPSDDVLNELRLD